ncbi:MAG TPA: SDR family oxidoreductase [Actinomycetota bacterium]
MDLGLKGRAAAVAAASKGLGRASAEALAREGCDVAICARGAEALAATADELRAHGVRVHAVAADLNAPDACERFVAEAADAFGRLDILVANNGGPPPGPVATFDDAAFRAAFEANLMVTVRLVRATLPHMRAGGWGRVIAITSAAAKEPIAGLGLSNTMRAGLAGFLKTLAGEVAADGVTVNTVAPGPFLTDRLTSIGEQRARDEGISLEQALAPMTQGIPVGRIGDPAELGALVAFLASERAAYVNGTTIQIDGGKVASLL